MRIHGWAIIFPVLLLGACKKAEVRVEVEDAALPSDAALLAVADASAVEPSEAGTDADVLANGAIQGLGDLALQAGGSIRPGIQTVSQEPTSSKHDGPRGDVLPRYVGRQPDSMLASIRGRTRMCLDRALSVNSTLKPKDPRVLLHVAQGGSVTNAVIEKSSGDPDLDHCIQRHAASLRYPVTQTEQDLRIDLPMRVPAP